MKNAIKTSAFFLAAVLYSLAVFFVYGVLSDTALHFSNPQETNEVAFLYAKPLNQNSTALPAKPLGFNEISCPDSSSARQYKLSQGIVKSTEQTISRTFARYIFQSINFPVHLRKAALLFPFHYFW